MPDGELDVAARLNQCSKTMVISALSASCRGHVPIITRVALCWKRTETSSQSACSALRRELAQKTPECRGKQHASFCQFILLKLSKQIRHHIEKEYDAIARSVWQFVQTWLLKSNDDADSCVRVLYEAQRSKKSAHSN